MESVRIYSQFIYKYFLLVSCFKQRNFKKLIGGLRVSGRQMGWMPTPSLWQAARQVSWAPSIMTWAWQIIWNFRKLPVYEECLHNYSTIAVGKWRYILWFHCGKVSVNSCFNRPDYGEIYVGLLGYYVNKNKYTKKITDHNCNSILRRFHLLIHINFYICLDFDYEINLNAHWIE